jgi:glutathione peroxidase
MKKTVYDFTVRDIMGFDKPLSDFAGKTLLIVNTASKCGFTPQFAELQKLYENYKDSGFAVLGFPCNQFMNQDPGTDEEIGNFCRVNYNVNFPMFSKIDVNGAGADPLYVFLKESLPGVMGSKAIKWNFTKFLVDKNGRPVNRYAPNTSPLDIAPDIEKLMSS